MGPGERRVDHGGLRCTRLGGQPKITTSRPGGGAPLSGPPPDSPSRVTPPTPPTRNPHPPHERLCVLPEDARRGAGSMNPAEGERKIVTALFADIQGSMDLMAELDPEEAEAVVAPALALMSDAVARYEGHVVQSTGDGVFA